MRTFLIAALLILFSVPAAAAPGLITGNITVDLPGSYVRVTVRSVPVATDAYVIAGDAVVALTRHYADDGRAGFSLGTQFAPGPDLAPLDSGGLALLVIAPDGVTVHPFTTCVPSGGWATSCYPTR